MALGFALVVERDEDAGVQERELAKALCKRVEAELDRLENFLVGRKGDLGTALLGRAGDVEIGLRLSARVLLLEHLPVPPDFEVELSVRAR